MLNLSYWKATLLIIALLVKVDPSIQRKDMIILIYNRYMFNHIIFEYILIHFMNSTFICLSLSNPFRGNASTVPLDGYVCIYIYIYTFIDFIKTCGV